MQICSSAEASKFLEMKLADDEVTARCGKNSSKDFVKMIPESWGSHLNFKVGDKKTRFAGLDSTDAVEFY
jgi:hypothetical protein